MTAVAALVAVALAVPMVLLVANDQRAAFVSQLEVETLAAASVLASQPDSAWPATVEDISAQAGARVVVVDDALVLVADSDNSDLDRSFDRPEVQSALEGSLTSSVRFSDTLGADLRYVAAPVIKDERVVAAHEGHHSGSSLWPVRRYGPHSGHCPNAPPVRRRGRGAGPRRDLQGTSRGIYR
jgi:phosphohistidine swiveling domain-containing protein